jgi:hypothetical protein
VCGLLAAELALHKDRPGLAERPQAALSSGSWVLQDLLSVVLRNGDAGLLDWVSVQTVQSVLCSRQTQVLRCTDRVVLFRCAQLAGQHSCEEMPPLALAAWVGGRLPLPRHGSWRARSVVACSQVLFVTGRCSASNLCPLCLWWNPLVSSAVPARTLKWCPLLQYCVLTCVQRPLSRLAWMPPRGSMRSTWPG